MKGELTFKTWTFNYNSAGQVTDYTHGNGLKTFYTYDDKGRLSTIAHKDGSTVLESFDYDVDDTVNITKVTHADGSYWDYGYDGRYRLTSASRKSASGNIAADFSYTDDDADNMLTKTESFAENFDDGNYAGWTTTGTWSAADGHMENALHAAQQHFERARSVGGTGELLFRYRSADVSSNGYYARVFPVFVDTSNYVELRLAPNGMSLRKRVDGTETVLDSEGGATSAADTWYTVRMRMDDANDIYTVERATEGGLFAPVLSHGADFGLSGNSAIRFHVRANAQFRFDDIEVRDGDMANTTTFEHNAANELTKMHDPYGGETTFTYDVFGRMVTKALEENDTDTFSAVYTYAYGHMLTNVDTDIPGERDVAYVYGGDGMRRQRTSGGVTTTYNWVNDEDANGDLVTSYVEGIAEIAGANPATGAYAHFLSEANGSPRAILDAGKAHLAQYEFTPYGRTLSHSGESFNSLYTGHEWDPAACLYYAGARYYNPVLAHWTTREPSGADGPNLYWYAGCSPASFGDPDGLEKQPFMEWLGEKIENNSFLNRLADTGECLDNKKWFAGDIVVGAGAVASSIPYPKRSAIDNVINPVREIRGLKPIRPNLVTSTPVTSLPAILRATGDTPRPWLNKLGDFTTKAPVKTFVIAEGFWAWTKVGLCTVKTQ